MLSFAPISLSILLFLVVFFFSSVAFFSRVCVYIYIYNYSTNVSVCCFLHSPSSCWCLAHLHRGWCHHARVFPRPFSTNASSSSFRRVLSIFTRHFVEHSIEWKTLWYHHRLYRSILIIRRPIRIRIISTEDRLSGILPSHLHLIIMIYRHRPDHLIDTHLEHTIILHM